MRGGIRRCESQRALSRQRGDTATDTPRASAVQEQDARDPAPGRRRRPRPRSGIAALKTGRRRMVPDSAPGIPLARSSIRPQLMNLDRQRLFFHTLGFGYVNAQYAVLSFGTDALG